MVTYEQEMEIRQAIEDLEQARYRLDNAMFRLGNINDEDYRLLRQIYNKICEAIDLYS